MRRKCVHDQIQLIQLDFTIYKYIMNRQLLLLLITIAIVPKHTCRTLQAQYLPQQSTTTQQTSDPQQPNIQPPRREWQQEESVDVKQKEQQQQQQVDSDDDRVQEQGQGEGQGQGSEGSDGGEGSEEKPEEQVNIQDNNDDINIMQDDIQMQEIIYGIQFEELSPPRDVPEPIQNQEDQLSEEAQNEDNGDIFLSLDEGQQGFDDGDGDIDFRGEEDNSDGEEADAQRQIEEGDDNSDEFDSGDGDFENEDDLDDGDSLELNDEDFNIDIGDQQQEDELDQGEDDDDQNGQQDYYQSKQYKLKFLQIDQGDDGAVNNKLRPNKKKNKKTSLQKFQLQLQGLDQIDEIINDLDKDLSKYENKSNKKSSIFQKLEQKKNQKSQKNDSKDKSKMKKNFSKQNNKSSDPKKRQIQKRFKNYQKRFAKDYSQQYSYRFKIFAQNAERVSKHNQNKNQEYKLSLNQYSDLTLKQFQSVRLMSGLGSSPPVRGSPLRANLRYDLKEIDWVGQKSTTQVQDQGNCGSSWIFSVIATLQSNNFIKNKGRIKHYSIQQTMDCCSQQYQCYGCTGTWPAAAFKYLANEGLALQIDYPYVGKVSQCKQQLQTQKIINKQTPFYQISTANDLAFALQRGPVSAMLDASKWDPFYKSGLFNKCSTQQLEYNHAVVVVGINSKGEWNVRNSWGDDWGERGGHIRLPAGNSCGLADWGVLPVIL